MSSRIDKGGARFKPSIVPRRSAGGSQPSSSAPIQPSSRSSSQQTSAAGPSAAGTGPPPSPSLTPQTSSRLTKPPSIGNTLGASTTPSTPSAKAKVSSSTTSTTQTPTTASTSISTSRSQSYAFNASPSVIQQPPSHLASSSASTSSPAAAKPKPVFRRPSVAKPPPGSRASLTPGPQFQNAPPQTSRASRSTADKGKAKPTTIAVGSDRSQRAGASNNDSPSDQAEPMAAEPSSRPSRTKLAPLVKSTRQQTTTADPSPSLKASQPDPPQFLVPTTPASGSRPSRAATTQRDAATPKESASQQETSVSTVLEAGIGPAETETLKASQDAVRAPATRKGKEKQAASATQSNGIAPDSDADDDTQAPGPSRSKTTAARKTRADAAARIAKRRLKRKEESLGKPKRPPSAYLLFVNSVRPSRQAVNPSLSLTEITSTIATEWRNLSHDDKLKWETDAASLKTQYEQDLSTWTQAHPDGVTLGPEDESDMETTSELDENGEPIRRRKRRRFSSRKPHTVSDDESEYHQQVLTEGPNLASSKFDPSTTSMGELSSVNYRKGRAGPRTFETDRVYKRMVDDRRAAAREALLGGHVLGAKVNGLSPSPAPVRLDDTEGAEEVEVVAGDESDEDEGARDTDADAGTEGEDAASIGSRRASKREPSVAATDVSFRENRFAVQTRIVDGKIVLDETSLFANFGHGEEDRKNMEVIDEREGDKFVNSSTYSRKLNRNRKWTAEETAKFYKSIQQWGTDFEMISRLFPGRDRVMIKKKFNAEERANPKLIDAAIRNTLPINLEAYAEAAGVDLSGPPPEIRANLQDMPGIQDFDSLLDGVVDSEGAKVKKREATAPLSQNQHSRKQQTTEEEEDDGYEYEELVDIDEHGNEQIVRRKVATPSSSSSKKKGSRAAARKEKDLSASIPSAPVSATATNSSTITNNEPATRAETTTPLATSASTEGTSEATKQAQAPPTITATRRKSSRVAKQQRGTEAPDNDRMEVEEIVGEI